jgi:hypothetical protein
MTAKDEFQKDIGKLVFFDIETAPMVGAEEYVDYNQQPPRNYKKPESIAAWQRTAVAEQLDKAALDPDLCRVVAIGWSTEDDGDVHSLLARNETEERQAISAFWDAVGWGCVVGYNCIGFDLPVLLRRSMYLGIQDKAPDFYLNKYRPSANVVDVMVRLSMEGLLSYRSLEWYARRFGVATKKVAAVTGRDIPRLVGNGCWNLVRDHVEDDVRLLRYLAIRSRIPKRIKPMVFVHGAGNTTHLVPQE